MSIDRSTTTPDESSQPNHQHIETDSEKIIHRHLKNKDDIITDEDIRNIRVGAVDEPSITGAAVESYLTGESKPNESESQNDKKDETPDKDVITPLDVIK